MRNLVRSSILASLPVLLAGCFMSQTQLVGDDVAVLPMDGAITVCLDESDPCLTLTREGLGYFAQEPEAPGEDILIRFAPLAQAAGRQVYIAEAGVRTEDGTAYLYGLARRLPQPDARGATVQVAALDCEDLDSDALDAFEAGGGMVEPGKVKECRPASLDHFKATLLAAHGSDLADEDWWLERAEDF